MDKIRLGRTGLIASRSGFGCIPIQRIDFDSAKALLRRAYESGINLFDTARYYTDSEAKIGNALSDVRKDIIIATKSLAQTAEAITQELDTSLKALKTDYIDIYQFHCLTFVIDEAHELYQALVKAKRQGKIRFISTSCHRLDVAKALVKTGLFDTMQYPMSAISTKEELELPALCKEHDVGYIGMKGLSGGLITDPTATFAFIRSLGNVVPIWGIEHMWQLEQFLKLEENPPALTDDLLAAIERDKKELSGNFCRACAYCEASCPAHIMISGAARMSLMLRRASLDVYTSPEQQAFMERVKDCINCGECKKRCPYCLDVPNIIRAEYDHYQKFLAEYKK